MTPNLQQFSAAEIRDWMIDSEVELGTPKKAPAEAGAKESNGRRFRLGTRTSTCSW